MFVSKPAGRLAAAFLAATAIGAFWNFPSAHASTVIHNSYDGVSDDLLTGGLGQSGLQGAAPSVSSPPTAAELRRLAIYTNYRGLVDTTTGGGFGVLFGPAVAVPGYTPTNGGKIAGDEYLTFDWDYTGRKNVSLMVQVPKSFDPDNACIVAAPSSGSNGIYGEIGTAGEWGLKHRCAVAYTDKGTGIGAHDLQNNLVNLIQGQQVSASAVGKNSIFTARLSDSELSRFNSNFPNRFAMKHAHSQQNPEKDWGQNVLASIRFAFQVLGAQFPGKISRKKTIVIASSISNGGGAALLAAEQDREGLIDGVAAGEPNVNPIYLPAFVIQQGSSAPVVHHSRKLIDYITLMDVYQGCANGAPANAGAPLIFLVPSAAGRCASLHTLGLLKSTTASDQETEAQQIINDYGILPEQNLVQPFYWAAYVSSAVAVTFANAYGRFSVADNLCNYSFAAIDANGHPAPVFSAGEAKFFGTLNGIPPQGGLFLINNGAQGGSIEDRTSVNPGGISDQNLNGALCLRSIATGNDGVTGAPLSRDSQLGDYAHRIQNGVQEILATGRVHGLPVTIVTGRSDGILPPNFASRAYYGLNKNLEPFKNDVHYYEVTNAHHLDAFNQFPGYDVAYIPLLRYYMEALDLMYARLKNNTRLPPSQVIHTIPRGGTPGAAPQITLANVPAIQPAAQVGPNEIVFTPGKLFIPQ